jgi:hypothetical protein
VWSNDPESYAGGSVATGRVSLAGKVKGDDPDWKGYHGPPGWGLEVRLTTSHRKKYCYETQKGGQDLQSYRADDDDDDDDNDSRAHCRSVIHNFPLVG